MNARPHAAEPVPTPGEVRRVLASHPPTGIERSGYRRAAVLVPLVARGAGWDLVLTRRTEDVEHHRGQISFPGGAAEDAERPEDTALREAWEEIRLPPEAVEPVGMLDDIWTPSRFVVTPVCAIVRSLEGLRANPSEVSRVFTAPLAYFADDANATVRRVELQGFSRDVYSYDYDGETIWGATAFIIRNLTRLLLPAAQHTGRGEEA